ncbi:transcriptional regulator [Burkholderiales bacterium JOSHI_001]|nr:transcriptional regulator [Burkholderiales bacterium JOSHI_001]
MTTSPTPDKSPRTDRRVLRTREALRGALLGLMVERGWDAIDIQSLCERANIGRSTFYLHFPNKEELLKGSFGDLRTALRDQAKQTAPESPDQLAFVGGLIEHVHQQQLVFRAMLGRRSGHYVQDRFRELLVDLVEEERPVGARRSWHAHAVSNYLGGALFQLLTWWLGASRPQRPQEIEALFHELSRPVLLRSRAGQ